MFLASVPIFMSKRRIPSVFFIKFIFSKLFIAIFTLKMFFYIPIQMDFKQKFFKLFTFVKILNHLQVQDLSNKKNRSFLRLLWAQIFLRQFIKFWHKCSCLVNVKQSTRVSRVLWGWTANSCWIYTWPAANRRQLRGYYSQHTVTLISLTPYQWNRKCTHDAVSLLSPVKVQR